MPEPGVKVEEKKFTVTEQKILSILADGMRHKREEFYKCIPDDLADMNNAISSHISNIRQKIRPKGQDIDCVFYLGSFYYRQFRLLANPDDGYT